MEELNGILTGEEENMHLLNDLFSDNLLAGKLIDNKVDKIELDDIYSFGHQNDEELRFSLNSPLDSGLSGAAPAEHQTNQLTAGQCNLFAVPNNYPATDLKPVQSTQFHPQHYQTKPAAKQVASQQQANLCKGYPMNGGGYSLIVSNQPQQAVLEAVDQNAKQQMTPPNQLSPTGQAASSLAKQNRKKVKNLTSQPKKKAIKFHEYKVSMQY